MKYLIILFILISVILGQDRTMKPYPEGVENLTYTNAFWLVAPLPMTEMLTTYTIKTNFLQKEKAYKIQIRSLITITNLNTKYIKIVEDKYSVALKELHWKQFKINLYFTLGVGTGAGVMYGAFYLASKYIK